ncbi:hypothetical protein A4R44_07328 [Amycolatopsis sp. M39]|nr:hypothetical protein A4R44_07328 [Amycolatopsis sp. M39]
MIEAIGYSGCRCALLAVAAKVESRRPAPQPGVRYLCMFIGCLTAGMTLLAVSGGNAASLLGDELKLASLAFLVLFARSLSPGQPTRRQARRALFATGEALAVNRVLLVVADAREVGGNTVVSGTGVLVPLIYYVICTAAAASALSLFIVLIWRYSRLGLAAARTVADSVGCRACWRQAASVPTRTPHRCCSARWLRADPDCRRLCPLWTVRRKAVPGIVLDPAAGRTWPATAARTLRSRSGRTGGVRLPARQDRPGAGTRHRRSSLDRGRVGRPPRGPPLPHRGGLPAALLAPTIAAETVWLTAVSRELRRPQRFTTARR